MNATGKRRKKQGNQNGTDVSLANASVKLKRPKASLLGQKTAAKGEKMMKSKSRKLHAVHAEIEDQRSAGCKIGEAGARLPCLRDLLGNFKKVIEAEKTARTCLSTPQALPRLFSSHELWTFPDRQLDSLNPGWEPTLHVFRLPPKLAAKLNPKLVDTALELEHATDGLKVSNLGGFHSDQYLFETPGNKALKLVRDIASAAVRCAEKEEFGKPPSKEDSEPTHSWVNVSRATNCNGLHDHTGATWSGCYYVSCCSAARSSVSGGEEPGSGDFVFRTAIGGLDQGSMAQVLSGAASGTAAGDVQMCPRESEVDGWCRYGSVRPEEGMLLLFPAWLLHCVMPLSESETGTRISIAFNAGEQDEAA